MIDMDSNFREKIHRELEEQKGHVGMYYKDLVTGEEFSYNGDEQFFAASVIKLPVFMCISKWADLGQADMREKVKVHESDKVPICGALTLFDGEPEVTVATLCRLMISISDNTATNMLINHFGMEKFRQAFREIGLKGTVLNRLLFDSEAGAKGLNNKIVPSEIAMLLSEIYHRSFVSRKVSEEINDVLLLQQINHKICGKLDSVPVEVAHKTGEDEGLTNDVGIIYAPKPFIVCYASHDTDVYRFEDFIRRTTYDICMEHM